MVQYLFLHYNFILPVSFLQLMAPLAVADNCRSASGLEGTCLSAQDCLKRGGRGLETCAWGLGVCCVRKYRSWISLKFSKVKSTEIILHYCSIGFTRVIFLFSYFHEKFQHNYHTRWNNETNKVLAFNSKLGIYKLFCMVQMNTEPNRHKMQYLKEK